MKNDKLKRLAEEVISRQSYPEDHYEIAAILESLGWNDERAFHQFGVRDVFELALLIWNIVKKNISYAPASPDKMVGLWAYLVMVLKSFIRGTIFALPMAVSVAAMLTLRFSLWSYENLSLELATSIAIGTILSFISVGGFIQAIARRGFLYVKQGYYNMARRMTYYFVRMGYLACIILAIVIFLLNSFLGVFPFRMLIIIILYFLFLNSIWLSITVMYILEKEITFTILMIAGISIVYLLFIVFNCNIIISQIIALAVVALAGIAIAMHFFLSAEKKMDKGIVAALPRTSITIYTIGPYFIYGIMYFFFLFADRMIAWSTNDLFMPYFIWFRGPYELGLDFALLALIMPMGIIEVVVNEVMASLEGRAKAYNASNSGVLNSEFVRLYTIRLIIVIFLSLINAVIVFFVLEYISAGGLPFFQQDLLHNQTTYFVFLWALAGYAFLVIGLMNVLLLFSLSQPEMVSRPLLIAIVINIIVGFLGSRWFGYSYAVIGLFAGSFFFAMFSSIKAYALFKNLDYYLNALT